MRIDSLLAVAIACNPVAWALRIDKGYRATANRAMPQDLLAVVLFCRQLGVGPQAPGCAPSCET